MNSPGYNEKKKARPIMSAMAFVKAPLEAVAMAKMRWMTVIGSGLTRLGSGSFLEYAFSI